MLTLRALRLLPEMAGSLRGGLRPYKVLLSVTSRCQLRCVACGIWKRPVGDELSPDEIGRVLGSLPSLRWLALTGGEIVARPDHLEVADVLRGVAGRLAFLSFPTNGFLPDATVAFARRLIHSRGPAPIVTVSLDGPREIHDALRGRDGAFDRAIETARRLAREPGVETYVGTTLGAWNAAHVDEAFAALREALPGLVPGRWHVNVMTHAPRFYGPVDEPEPSRDDVLEATRRVEALRGLPRTAFAVVEKLFLRNARYRAMTGLAPAPCQALLASLHVSATGVVAPCHARGPDLGNVRDTGLDLARLLASPAARSVRDGISGESCAACWSPCEAYHAILASPVVAVARAFSSSAR
jgi:MoaA/NifB/PqqE/SkfB family radical SAM enzyme